MSDITREQLEFLDSQKIPLGRVFDATGMRKSEYRAAMKTLDMCLAVGVSPCEKGEHTIRTRHGHCAQCNPAAIAFQNRYSQLGFVYVAGSRSLQLIKIGCALNVNHRMGTLNSLGYGGVNDWLWLHAFYVFDCGRIEYNSQLYLRNVRESRIYVREGKKVNCLETLRYGHDDAMQVVLHYADGKCHYYRNENSIPLFSSAKSPQESEASSEYTSNTVPIVPSEVEAANAMPPLDEIQGEQDFNS